MKKLLTVSFLLGLLALSFMFKKETSEVKSPARVMTPPTGNNISGEFLIWAMDVGKSITDTGGNNYVMNYTPLQDMNFNVWHKYPMVWDNDYNNDPWNNGWTFKNFISNDRLLTDVGDYDDMVISKVIAPNNTHNMYTIMDRPKIEYLCYGARSDYQAETENYIQNQDLKFYNYMTHQTGADYEETFNN